MSRPRRAAATLNRRTFSYHESSSEDDEGFEEWLEEATATSPASAEDRSGPRDSGEPSNASPQSVTLPRRKRPASYKEYSSSGDGTHSDGDGDEDDEDASGEDEDYSHRRKPAKRARTTRRGGKSRTARRKQADKPRERKSRSVRKASRQNSNNLATQEWARIETDGVIPPWTTLPYDILLQIFRFASYPLHDENFMPTASINWLLNAACVCRAFAEPALTVLYNCPPLLALDKPHRLVDLLSQPSASHYINYSVKVKRLELDYTRTLAYSTPGRGVFDIGTLLPHLPQLSEISILDPLDKPPYRRDTGGVRWHYSASLFEALDEHNPRLKSWRWNLLLTWSDRPLHSMKALHQKAYFQGLESIRLTHFDIDQKAYQTDEGNVVREGLLADALSALPHLQALTFESSTVVNEHLLELLPDRLVSLTIINCALLTSEALGAFLITHGSRMRELVLNHNQALDIAFLPDLRRACPKLEVLKMDLNYFSTLFMSDDSEPKYEDLLKPEEVPAWPSTLQTIEMVYLRKWTSEAVEVFFNSLIGSAAGLPDLRKLVLKVILNISWRDRAGFRDRWIGRLQDVFQRKPSLPKPYLASFKTYRDWTESLGGRLRSTPSPGSKQEPDANDNSWGARRLRPRARLSYTSGDDDDDSQGTPEADAPKDWDANEKVIQGMCEVVDIRIDNIRPREDQFNENDFLDPEVSGDEDYNGRDDIVEPDQYAW